MVFFLYPTISTNTPLKKKKKDFVFLELDLPCDVLN